MTQTLVMPDLHKVYFRLPGVIPNLKNQHEIGQRRTKSGKTTPFIRRSPELIAWMAEARQEAARQLKRQLEAYKETGGSLREDTAFPRHKEPFTLTAVIWSYQPFKAGDIDGQMNTLLDVLQAVAFKDDRYCIGITARRGEVMEGMDFTDIVIDFRPPKVSVDSLRSLVPVLYEPTSIFVPKPVAV